MGRKRTSSSPTSSTKPNTNRRQKAKKTRAKKTIATDMLGGILVVIGLILLVFYTFSNIGVFADVVNNISKGLFGNIVFLLPIIFAIITTSLIKITSQVYHATYIKKTQKPIFYYYFSVF